jgi:hypothetical protein
MAVEKDQARWLPDAPPPRPAGRDAAIEAALSRFDGATDTPPARVVSRKAWFRTHRPQLGLVLASTLILVVGIPAAFIGLRNQGSPPESTPTAASETSSAADNMAAPRMKNEPSAVVPPVSAPQSAAETSPVSRAPANDKPETSSGSAQAETPEDNRARAQAAPSPPPLVAPPGLAPAPAPPPPPPPAAQSDEASRQLSSQNLVVTGSRIPAPAQEGSKAAEVTSPERSYEKFLAALKASVETDDERAIVKLIGFPLRVNFPEGPRSYSDPGSVHHDFSRIFTARVKKAILRQRADRLFVRDQGAMVGSGEIWFARTCANPQCTPPGPVKITSVNP